jgi:hypothetical protein
MEGECESKSRELKSFASRSSSSTKIGHINIASDERAINICNAGCKA